MEIVQAFKTLTLLDIAYQFSTKIDPKIEAKRLSTWYRKSKLKYGFDDAILNVAIALGMRVKKDHEIPNNKYLNSVLERFKKFEVQTLDDALSQLQLTIAFETKKKTTNKNTYDQQIANSPKFVQDYMKKLQENEDLAD